MDANNTHREKARWELHKNNVCCLGQILKAIPNKTAIVWPPTFNETNHLSKTDS